MKWKIISEGGSEFELDSQLIESFEVDINGKRYEIGIKEL